MAIFRVLQFGIARELSGSSVVEIERGADDPLSVAKLKFILESQHPALRSLGSYLIAVNNEYADADTLIREGDEIAVIPPVSGG